MLRKIKRIIKNIFSGEEKMLQEEVQVNEQLTSDEEVWDEWGNRFVTWSLSTAIAVLVSMSFLINFFLV